MLSNRGAYVCYCLALSVSSVAVGVTNDELTFAKAFDLARQHDVSMRAATAATASAQSAKQIVDDADDPSISLESAWGRSYRDKTASQTRAGTADQLSSTQKYGVSAAMPVYDFGRQSAKEKVAERATDLAKLAESEAVESLRWSVANAYLATLIAHRAAVVVEDQVRVAKAKADSQTRNYKQGLRPESDIVQAEVDLGRTEIARAKATDATVQAELSLGSLIGTEAPRLPSGPVLTPEATAAIVEGWKAPPQSLIEQRHELTRQSLEAELAGVRADRRPRLDAVVAAERSGTWTPLGTTASGQLRLTWDVPWNGAGREREQIVALKTQTLLLDVEATTQSVRDAVRLSTMSLTSSVRLAKALQRQKSLSERQLKLVQSRYEAGKASALEVSTAEGTLLAVNLDLIDASEAATQAALTLAKAQGVKDVEGLFP